MRHFLAFFLLSVASVFGQGTVTGTRLQIGNGASTIAGSLGVTGAVTGSTFNKLTLTQPASSATLTILNGKTLTVNDLITLASDGTGTRTLNIGAGGTLGTAAFTAASSNSIYTQRRFSMRNMWCW